VSHIDTVPHEKLWSAAADLRLVLTTSAVHRVVSSLIAGEISPSEAQRWASFVRRGYADGGAQPIRPLDIEYEASREGDIVEVVGRLDEIGDRIDGNPSEQEQRQWLASLGEP
jgi:hypothetical protein